MIKNIFDITDIAISKEEDIVISKEERLTTEDSLSMLQREIVTVNQYVEMLTKEDAVYVEKLKPFFIDSVQKIVGTFNDLKDKLFMKSDVFKDKINDLNTFGKFNRDVKTLKFSKYNDMMLPVMLGTNANYLVASQKLIKFPEYIDGLNIVITKFVNNLEQMMNEKSDDRLALRKFDDRYFDIANTSSETGRLVSELVNSKANNDMMKLEYLLPNFTSLDTIRDNFIIVCQKLNKADISKLEDNVSMLVKAIDTWQRALKNQDDTRHSSYMVGDIKTNIIHIAELVTNMGMLITITFQYTTFYNRTVAELHSKITNS